MVVAGGDACLDAPLGRRSALIRFWPARRRRRSGRPAAAFLTDINLGLSVYPDT
jgi:hypothetical protein